MIKKEMIRNIALAWLLFVVLISKMAAIPVAASLMFFRRIAKPHADRIRLKHASDDRPASTGQKRDFMPRLKARNPMSSVFT